MHLPRFRLPLFAYLGLALLTLARADVSIVATGTTTGSTYALAGSAYTQTFDTLPTANFTWANDTTLPGWFAADATGALNTAARTLDGSANPNDLTLASTGIAGSAERALVYHTRVATTPTHLGLAFTNASGQPLTAFSLSFAAEQWKESGSTRNLTLAVSYRVGATLADLPATTGWTDLPALTFSTLNGSAPASTPRSVTDVPVNVPAGATLWLRWTFTNSATSSTSSHDILALDDVVFSAASPAGESAPAFTAHPASRTVALGASTTFTATVTGQPTPTLQWFKGPDPVPDATSSSLALPAVTLADAGSYTLVATNALGQATSDPAVLTVSTDPVPPTIVTGPASLSVASGAPASFTVTATGTPPLTYLWFKGDSPLPAATEATFTLPAVTLADAGSYHVVVTNSAGSTPSSPATLTVLPPAPPTLVASPVSLVRMNGGTAVFRSTFQGTPPLTYTWLKGDAPIPGATGPTLTLANLSPADAATYRVTATNFSGTATSAPATLRVVPRIPESRFSLTGFAALPVAPGSPSHPHSPPAVTGGGVIPETDPAYRKVYTALDLATAIRDASKTAGSVRVIEIMNDLDLGWNQLGDDVKALASTPFVSAATPQLHPTLLTTGVSTLTLRPRSGLTIFSAHGATLRHVSLSIKDCSNVIIRNLRFDGLWEWDEATKGDYDRNNWDFIVVGVGGGSVDHIWVDHCTFTKAYDGIIDTKGGTSNVTYSWNAYLGDDGVTNADSHLWRQLHALEAARPRHAMYEFLRTRGFSQQDIFDVMQGPGKIHAIGELSLHADNPHSNVTFHHQWYLNPWDRLPRLAGGTVHNYSIFVDATAVLDARRLRDARFNALSSADQLTFTNNYNFRPPINGSISTEDGAMLVEKSYYRDCVWPLRNNQTDPSNPIYTGKIKATDTIYTFRQTDGSTTTVRGDSTDAGNPLGPFQAAIKPFSWNTADGSAPYTLPASAYTDPAALPDVVTAAAGAGVLTWDKSNWLKTTYEDAPVSAYDAFVTAAGLDPLTTGAPTANPSGDGLPNLLKFALGGDPLLPQPDLLPTALLDTSATPPHLTYTYERALAAVAAGLVFTHELSPDLATWTPVVPGTAGATLTVTPLGTTLEQVLVRLPAPTPRAFLRLRVTAP